MDAERLVRAGAVVIDTRPSRDYATAHLSGSQSIELRDALVEIAGGIPAAAAAGIPLASTAFVGPDGLDGRTVLDVRQAGEFAAGHLPTAENVELAELLAPDRIQITAGPLVTMCGHGERALTAASLLERAGHRDVSVLLGGPADWAAVHGATLATGP